MIVHFTNSQHLIEVSSEQVHQLVACILQKEQVTCDEVSIHFVNIEDICKLHEEYFDDPSPTDCISFPMDDLEDDSFYKILGEIFVCPDIALEYSQANLLNFEEELTLYVVHGILHLLGYDDIDEEDQILMRSKEASCMQLLQEKNLILKTTTSLSLKK
ncbi:MAG: rRNA maturation RNase YbeY [Chlamydiota bacterium]